MANRVNHIPLELFKFSEKTMPQLDGKVQGMLKWHPLERNKIRGKKCCTLIPRDSKAVCKSYNDDQELSKFPGNRCSPLR